MIFYLTKSAPCRITWILWLFLIVSAEAKCFETKSIKDWLSENRLKATQQICDPKSNFMSWYKDDPKFKENPASCSETVERLFDLCATTVSEVKLPAYVDTLQKHLNNTGLMHSCVLAHYWGGYKIQGFLMLERIKNQSPLASADAPCPEIPAPSPPDEVEKVQAPLKKIAGSAWTEGLDCRYLNPPREITIINKAFDCKSAVHNLVVVESACPQYFRSQSTVEDGPIWCLTKRTIIEGSDIARSFAGRYCDSEAKKLQ